jgi:hypothetical protein
VLGPRTWVPDVPVSLLHLGPAGADIGTGHALCRSTGEGDGEGTNHRLLEQQTGHLGVVLVDLEKQLVMDRSDEPPRIPALRSRLWTIVIARSIASAQMPWIGRLQGSSACRPLPNAPQTTRPAPIST